MQISLMQISLYLYDKQAAAKKYFPQAKIFNSESTLYKAIRTETKNITVVIVVDSDVRTMLSQIISLEQVHSVVLLSEDTVILAELAASFPQCLVGPLVEEYTNFINLYFKREKKAERSTIQGLIGENKAFINVVEQAIKAARTEVTVLLQGESGTGKELFAKGIHTLSARSKKPFIAVNCAAIPKELLEIEFFGATKGAFTDATKKRDGYFVAASGGTLFLDEIAELPLLLQAKLLRVLQEKQITAVGSSETISVDVRIIAATHKNLSEAVSQGSFRQDLFFRLQVVSLQLPALRERSDDIALLASGLLDKIAKKYNKKKISIAESTLFALEHYNWPGNVRELEHVLEQAVIMSNNSVLTNEDLPNTIRQKKIKKAFVLPKGFSLKKAQSLLEEYLIAEALEESEGNKTHAAKLLEVSHRWLLYTLKNNCKK